MREDHDIQLTPAERGRLISISLTRPLNLTALATGGIVSAAATSALLLAATLIVYILLAALTFRDPLFRNRALQSSPADYTNALPPERKATWLPRGETRKTVEAALVAYRRSLKEIETSEEVTREVMSGSTEGLHTAAHSLVELALGREKARHALENARQSHDTGELASLQREIEQADKGIREISSGLNNLRTRLVRLSVSSQNSSTNPEEITRALRELEAKAEALDALLPGHRTD